MPADPTSDTFDLVIVGAGPAGLAAGTQAAERGMSYVVLERAKLANTIELYQKHKHVMAEPVAIPLRGDLKLSFAAGSREDVLSAWEKQVADLRVNLWQGPEYEVLRVEGELGRFRVHLKGGRTLSCARIVLALGVQNLRTFGVPGEALRHVSYQLDDPADYEDKRVVVVGVGDAGIENALALAEGNRVALVNRGEEFEKAKPGNRVLIEAAIRTGRIAHYTNARVKYIEESAVILEVRSEELRLEVDLLLGRLGAIPPRTFLESSGIKLPSTDSAAVPQVSQSYESNVPGIHVIGALVGSPLIKQCMNQGYEVIEYILGHEVEPADEPLLREKFKRLPGTVAEVLERIRGNVPLFATLTTIQLREFLVDSDIELHESNEVIFRRNDFSDEFYSILAGTVEIVAPSSDADADTIYKPADRDTNNVRRIRLGPSEFFGEMSLISGRRRTGSAITTSNCVLLRTPRLSMSKLFKSVQDLRRLIDETFIVRKLQTSLAPDVATIELRDLAQAAVLKSFNQGETLFKEGDPSDGLHLIRRGSVTITIRGCDRDMVVEYLPAGNVVGEMGFLSPQQTRTATVRAAVYSETIFLPNEPLRHFLERHPELHEGLRAMEGERLIENASRAGRTRSGDVMNFILDAGAGEATDILLIDESLCIACNNCEDACASTHHGLSRLDREAGPSFANVHIPTACRHCENPKCMTDCPPDALRRHPNGEVFIMDNCIGCGNCVTNCPYEVIKLESVDKRNALARWLFGSKADKEKKAVKCDLCVELPTIRRGPGQTACVSSCPTGAILRVDPKTYLDKMWWPNE